MGPDVDFTCQILNKDSGELQILHTFRVVVEQQLVTPHQILGIFGLSRKTIPASSVPPA